MIDVPMIGLAAASLGCIYVAGRTIYGPRYTVRRFIADLILILVVFAGIMILCSKVFGA